MAVTEEEHHELHSCLEDQAGPQIAATLMKHLPPVGWMDVTTNTELEHMRHQLLAEIRAVDSAFRAELSTRLERQTRAMVLAMVGSMATMTSLVVAAIGLTS